MIIDCKPGDTVILAPGESFISDWGFQAFNPGPESMTIVLPEPRDQTDLGASDDRPLGPDHIVYRSS